MSDVGIIEFTVHGKPQQQGSKNPWGGEANKHLQPWRGAVSAAAAEALGEEPIILGPVSVEVLFIFARPKAHYRTGKNADQLKDSAPYFNTGFPDLDKLCRAIGDALTGVVIRDDKQIAKWDVVKLYGEKAKAFIRILRLPERS